MLNLKPLSKKIFNVALKKHNSFTLRRGSKDRMKTIFMKEIENKNKEIEDLQQRLRKACKYGSDLLDNNLSLQNQLEKTKNQNEELINDNNFLKEKLDGNQDMGKAMNDQMKSENELLKSKLMLSEKDLENVLGNNKILRSSLQQMKLRIFDLKSSSEYLDQRRASLKRKLEERRYSIHIDEERKLSKDYNNNIFPTTTTSASPSTTKSTIGENNNRKQSIKSIKDGSPIMSDISGDSLLTEDSLGNIGRKNSISSSRSDILNIQTEKKIIESQRKRRMSLSIICPTKTNKKKKKHFTQAFRTPEGSSPQSVCEFLNSKNKNQGEGIKLTESPLKDPFSYIEENLISNKYIAKIKENDNDRKKSVTSSIYEGMYSFKLGGCESPATISKVANNGTPEFVKISNDNLHTIISKMKDELKEIKNVKEDIKNHVYSFKDSSITQIAKIAKIIKKNDLDYADMQLKIIKELGLLDFYKTNKLKPNKGGKVQFKHNKDKKWTSCFAEINEIFAISFYKSKKKMKLLKRLNFFKCNLITKIKNKDNQMLLRFDDDRNINFKFNNPKEKEDWIGFLKNITFIMS